MKGIYAIGDMTGRQLLAHKAMAEGVVAAEAIAGRDPRPVDYGNVPSCTYCRPQVASIGAHRGGGQGRWPRGVASAASPSRPTARPWRWARPRASSRWSPTRRTGEILGVHIVGPEATEMIHEFAVGRTLEATLEEIIHTIHAHPDAVRGRARGHAGRARPGHPHLSGLCMDFQLTRRSRRSRRGARELADGGVSRARRALGRARKLSLGQREGSGGAPASWGSPSPRSTAAPAARSSTCSWWSRRSRGSAASPPGSSSRAISAWSARSSRTAPRRRSAATCPGCSRGDKPAIAITEPEAGSAATDLVTRADEAPKGWTLHGEKRWITGAGMSRLHLVYCRHERRARRRGHRRHPRGARHAGLPSRRARPHDGASRDPRGTPALRRVPRVRASRCSSARPTASRS